MKEHPLTLQPLPDDVEKVFSKLASIIKERQNNLGLSDLENILRNSNINKAKNFYEELKRSQRYLHDFTETYLLTQIRNGAFGYDNNSGRLRQIIRLYTIVARTQDEVQRATIKLDRKKFEQYKDADAKLADEIAREHFETFNSVVLSFIQYLPGAYATLQEEVRTMEGDLKKQGQYPERTAQRANIEKKLERARKRLEEFREAHGVLWIGTRVKGAESLVYKITDKLVRLDEITRPNKIIDGEMPTAIKDVLGVKIIVNNEAGKEQVVTYLHTLCNIYETIILGEVKDHWRNPKIVEGKTVYEGWKSVIRYHGVPIEVQIQTPEMHERGEADHPSYKERQMQRRWVATTLSTPYIPVLRVVSKVLGLPLNESEASYWLENPPWPRREQERLKSMLTRS